MLRQLNRFMDLLIYTKFLAIKAASSCFITIKMNCCLLGKRVNYANVSKSILKTLCHQSKIIAMKLNKFPLLSLKIQWNVKFMKRILLIHNGRNITSIKYFLS